MTVWGNESQSLLQRIADAESIWESIGWNAHRRALSWRFLSVPSVLMRACEWNYCISGHASAFLNKPSKCQVHSCVSAWDLFSNYTYINHRFRRCNSFKSFESPCKIFFFWQKSICRPMYNFTSGLKLICDHVNEFFNLIYSLSLCTQEHTLWQCKFVSKIVDVLNYYLFTILK